MKKALMIASVASMIEQFNMSNITILKKLGFEVHVAANFRFGSTCPKDRVIAFQKELYEKDIQFTHINFDRNIFRVTNNTRAYWQIKRLIEENQYEIIHCHSPIGGVLTRLAAKNTKSFQGKVIYTAHGFHFYKGAPLKNWLLYYPIERWLSNCTDILITINQEDYAISQKFSYKKGGKSVYIPGVGVDVEKIRGVKVERAEKRRALGILQDKIMLLSVGELNKNKNHELIIRAIARLHNNNLVYFICGVGSLEKYLKKLVQNMGLEKQIHFMGYRTDVIEIMRSSDLFIFPSHREGLSVALMQAMAAGLPVVCSKIRGNVDLIKDGENGYLVDANDLDGFCDAMSTLINHKDSLSKMSRAAGKKIERFDLHDVAKQMEQIYEDKELKKTLVT